MIKVDKNSIQKLKETKKLLTSNGLIGTKNELIFRFKNIVRRYDRIAAARPHASVLLNEEMNGNILRICAPHNRL